MNPLHPHQSLVKPTQLAELLGVSRATLHRWTINEKRVRDCLFRPGFFSVQKLREVGLLVSAEKTSTNETR